MMYIYNQIHVKKYVSFLKERIAEIKYYNRLKVAEHSFQEPMPNSQ